MSKGPDIDVRDQDAGYSATVMRDAPRGPQLEALGAIETRSIALGIFTADAMCKAAEVELLMAMPTCPGKYMVMVSGSVAAVRAAVEAGKDPAADSLVDFMVIPRIHASVIPALSGMTHVEDMGAIGILETFSMTASVRAADEAVKAADVTLIEVRLGRGLAGKAYVILTGEVAAVRAANEAALTAINEKALVLSSVVIASPHPLVLDKLL